jgi:hypothetical protein
LYGSEEFVHQNVLHLDGTAGSLILAGSVIGGLVTIAVIIGVYRASLRRRAARLAALRPHPATRTYTEPPSFQSFQEPSFWSPSLQAPPAGAHSAGPAHRARSAPGDRGTRAAQPRFHGHAIAPPSAFPSPPRFAPQPLHSVPSPRPAPVGSVAAHAQYPAHHRPSAAAAPPAHAPAAAHAQAPARMAPAPVTDPFPKQPPAIPARHRASNSPA